MKMLVFPGESRKINLIIQTLGIGGALFFGIILWLFMAKKHDKWLTEIQNLEISGVITKKEIKEKQFLLNIKKYSPTIQDTSADFRPWGKLFDQCNINDTLIKKANSFNIMIKGNGQIRIFTLAPEYL
jgi:hypothetical protein